MESVGYVLFYLLRGSLPWQGLKIKNNEDRYKKICDKKVNIPLEELGKEYPEEFIEYLKSVRKLGFEDTPNYKFYRGLFVSLMLKCNFELDYEYVWSKVSKATISQISDQVPFALK